MTKRLARVALIGAAFTAFALPVAPAAAGQICPWEDPTLGPFCVSTPDVGPICVVQEPTIHTYVCV